VGGNDVGVEYTSWNRGHEARHLKGTPDPSLAQLKGAPRGVMLLLYVCVKVTGCIRMLAQSREPYMYTIRRGP
jgi:hypothetical protein